VSQVPCPELTYKENYGKNGYVTLYTDGHDAKVIKKIKAVIPNERSEEESPQH
jgi:hypothetical protein